MLAARVLLRVLFWTLVPPLALVFSVWLHLGDGLSRRAGAELLEAFLRREVKGSLHVGHVDELSLSRLVVRDVVVTDDRGRVVATAERVVGTPALASLVRGEVRFTYAKLEHGRVRLYFDEGDLPTLITAFQPRHPGVGPSHAPHVLLDDVRVHEVHVAGDVPGVRNLVVEHVQGAARIESTAGELDLRVRWLTGRVTSPFAPPADIASARLTLVTQHALDLAVAARNDAGDTATGHLAFALHEPREVDLVVHSPHLAPATLTGAGVPGLERVRGPVHGWARLHGVPPDLAFDADLEGDAGRAVASGTLRPDAIDVAARTDGLALERLIDGAPEVRVAATGTVHAPRGDGAGAAPTFHVESQPFTYRNVAVPAARVDGAFDTGRVRLSRVEARDGGGTITGDAELGTDGRLAFRIRGHFDDVRDEPTIHGALPALRGALDADLALVRETTGLWDVRGHAALTAARQSGLRAGRLVFDGRLSGDLAAPAVAATLTARDASVSGFLLGSGRARVTGGPRSYRAVASFAAAGGRTIALDAHAERQGDVLVIAAPTASITFGPTTWRGEADGIRVRPDHEVAIGLVRVANGSQRLEVRGAYRFHAASDIDAQLQDLDLTLLRTVLGTLPVDVGGRADAHVVLHGDLARPDVQLDGALREGRVGRVEGVEAVYSVQLADGALSVDGQLDLGDRGTFAVSGTGQLDTDRAFGDALRDGAYDGRVDVDRFDLATIASMIDDPRLASLDGDASGRVDITGTREHPTIDAVLQVDHVPLPQSPEVSVTTTAHWESDLLHGSVGLQAGSHPIVSAILDAELEPLEVANGTFDWRALLRDGPWAVQAEIPAVRLDELPEPWRSRVRGLPVRVDGELEARNGPEGSSATLTVSGAWLGDTDRLPCGRGTRPRVEVTLGVDHDQLLAHGRGSLRPDAGALEVEASATVPVGQFLATLAAPGSWPAVHLTANVPAVELGEVPWACERATGRVGASLTVENGLTDAPSGRLVSHVEGLRVNGQVPATLDLEATASSRAIVADATLSFDDGGHSDLQVMLESTWNGMHALPDVSPDARFQLQAGFQQTHGAPLLVFVPGITDADAIVDGQLQAQGTRSALTWSGRLALRQGHLELTGPGQRIDDFEADLSFHDQRADVTRLLARDTDGRLRAHGYFDFTGILPSSSSLAVSLDSWPVRREGLVLATVNGTADVGAHVHMEHTDLDVTVRSLTVRLPDDTLPTLQSLDENPDIVVVGREAAVAEATTPYPVHIRVDARSPFWVRRQDFAAEIAAVLHVTYESPDLSVGGWVRLRRGWFELYGKRFALQRGSMVFDGSNSLDPEVDLVATYELPGDTHRNVSVAVSGLASDPHIELSSNDPNATDQGTILALLVSGRPTLTSNPGGQADPNAIANETRSFLTGVVLGLATVSLRREFGDVLPMFAIDTSATGAARVRAGIQADSFIREHMQWLSGVVQSAYLEGFVTTSSGVTNASTTTSGPGGGFLIELGFPHDFVGTMTYTYPTNFGLDVTWEP